MESLFLGHSFSYWIQLEQEMKKQVDNPELFLRALKAEAKVREYEKLIETALVIQKIDVTII